MPPIRPCRAMLSRRWVIDSVSIVDIVGEGSVTKKEKKLVEEVSTPMPLNTANGEVTAPKKVKVLLRPSAPRMP